MFKKELPSSKLSLSQVKIAVDLGYQGIKWVDEVIFQVAGLWNLKIRC